MTITRVRALAIGLAVSVLLIGAAGCSSSPKSNATPQVAPEIVNGQLVHFNDPVTLKVVTHDSFAISQSVLDEFTAATNITVEMIPSGDAVAMTNTAILTTGNPVGDVLFGIDENLLGAAFDANLFTPYSAVRLGGVDQQYVMDAESRVTPIDHGDVCVNFDRNSYTKSGTAIPTTFEGLTAAADKDSFVAEDPSASTPGLSFMLATIAHFGGGDDTTSNAAWLQYWKSLKANGVQMADGWETAYYGDFSGGSGKGSRPLVVSYASSPPAEVTDTSLPVDQTPTGVITSTCYRQTEFAGILRGAQHPEAAAAFIEFMLGSSFQQDMPAQMYVYPVVTGTPVPDVFAKYTAPVSDPLSIPYAEVTANRDRWVEQWSALFR